MNEESSYQANLQRGILLREQGRYKEASKFLGKAIEVDPQNAAAYAELAFCFNDWDGNEKRALEAIDAAIHLEPDNDGFFASKGWILICQKKYEPALEASKSALAIAPLNLAGLNVQVNAYSQLREWKKPRQLAFKVCPLQRMIHRPSISSLRYYVFKEGSKRVVRSSKKFFRDYPTMPLVRQMQDLVRWKLEIIIELTRISWMHLGSTLSAIPPGAVFSILCERGFGFLGSPFIWRHFTGAGTAVNPLAR